MTKQQLAHASKLLMELAEIFHQASLNVVTETVIEEANVIQPLVEVEGVVIADVPTTEPVEEDAEDLSSMTIQQLRALAKSNGLSTKGTKKDLISRITESNEVVDIEEPSIEEPVENEIEEVIEDELIEEDEDVELIEDEEDVEVIEEDEEMSHMEVIQAELEDMSLDELKEILESVDLPTKGKKQALISRILEAVENGVLEFEEEVDEEYEADEIDEDLDVEEADFEEIVEEDEEDEVIEDEEEEIEDDLSPREATQQEVEEQILEDYENGDLTDKQIAKFLDEYFNGKFKPLNKKRALNKYIEIHCDLVDVDGDVMPMKEAYFVDEETIFCCGSEVNELDNGNLYCEVCGQEYETE